MGKRKGKSMYSPYRNEIIKALDKGMTVKEIFREIIYPAFNGGCEYGGFVYYINANDLRNATDNDGYEIAPECNKCESLGTMRRVNKDMKALCYCRREEKEICRLIKSSPRWCPKRDQKRQGEI